MNEHNYEYRNGQTKPEKSHGGLIAFLLICIIFLCGVVSVLSLMNVRLFQKLEQLYPDSPLSFQEGDTALLAPEGDCLTISGITLQELPDLYGQLYDLPAGLYVVDAPQDGSVLPGDILTDFDASPVSSLAMLDSLQNACQVGQQITLTFYRRGAEPFTHIITFGN